MLKKLRAMLEKRPNYRESPDPTPVALATQLRRPPTLQEQIQRYVLAANALARQQGAESFEEADDFEVDEFDPNSPYEMVFDPIVGKEVTRPEAEFNRRNVQEFDAALKQELKKKRSSQEEKPKARNEQSSSASPKAKPDAE